MAIIRTGKQANLAGLCATGLPHWEFSILTGYEYKRDAD